MTRNERVVEALNRALHTLLAEDPRVMVIGEDILDPYGGAFKASKGLSSRFPHRVLCTPICEETLIGIGGGLALCGASPIVEVMFGDFLALGFDQIINFATKSVSMYGREIPMNLVIRCPVGANRGYGPTHSQNLQKHFIGIPHLSLFELSPFHDPVDLLRKVVSLGHPSILFEDKVLYPQRMCGDGVVDDVFHYTFIDPERNHARICSEYFDAPKCLMIAPGGVAARCIAAARDLFVDFELEAQVVVPAQLYPFDVDPLYDILRESEHIFVVEEGVAGGTWGAEVAHRIYERLWNVLPNRIHLIHSKASVIPTALHLERQVVVQKDDIYRALAQAVSAGELPQVSPASSVSRQQCVIDPEAKEPSCAASFFPS